MNKLILSRSTIQLLALLIITLLVYYPVLNNDFQYGWDDNWMVINHYTEGGWTLDNLHHIFTDFYNGQYGPFTELSYLMVYTCFGYDPFWFHFLSLLLHIFNVLLVYIVLKKLFILSNRFKNIPTGDVAFWVTVVFSIHTLQLETVAWISASKALIYGFFYLLATYTWLLYLERKKIMYYLYTVVFFICSFMGKEQAVIFPVWLCLISLFIKKASLKEFLNECKLLVPYFVIAACMGIITMFSQAGFDQEIRALHSGYPFWQRILYGCFSFVEYVLKFLLPYKLLYIYPFPNQAGKALPTWMLLYPVLLSFSFIALWDYIKKWPVWFGLLFFIIHISLTLHILSISRFAITADRYIYVGIIGLAFLGIMGYYYLKSKFPRSKTVLQVVLISYLCILACNTHLRCKVWYNSEVLKADYIYMLQDRYNN